MLAASISAAAWSLQDQFIGKRTPRIAGEAHMNWPHLLFGIRGRINRAKWWIASFILIIIGFVVSKAIDWFDFAAVAAALNRFAAISLAVVLALVSLLIVYCLLAVTVKRLHDRNKRGWWILMFPLAPVILASIASAFGEDLEPALDYAVWAVVLIIAIWALIEFGCMAGMAGLNRYGPDPLAKIRGDPRQGGGSSASSS
jgi:uncharacterized membrane protein YhaH (DUF805 family)